MSMRRNPGELTASCNRIGAWVQSILAVKHQLWNTGNGVAMTLAGASKV